jgi:hypothetical protein
MKSAKFPVYLACSIVLALTSMSAQTGAIRAKIPFDFNTGEQTLRAGDYKVSIEGRVLHIERLDGPGFAFVSIYSHGYNKDASPKLVFHRYGPHSFLAEAWIAASGHELWTSPREGEFARTAKQERTIVIASTLSN